MSAPLPKQALSGHCSVIDSETLYVLSSDSFQALPLRENATWTSLEMGTAVKGPQCVRALSNGDESQAALYVVGGESDDESYGGLQRYVFSSKSWETMTPPTDDMKGRTSHGVAYLDDESAILVYAGSKASEPTDLSTQTFVISTKQPYNIESFTSKAPPVSNPVVLPWNSSAAVMVGGSATNTDVWTFTSGSGWQKLDTGLSSALSSSARGSLLTGSDGSKVLAVYDASTSPNTVSQYVLLGAHGETATTGQTVGGSASDSSSRKRKRDMTLADWPAYNSSLAPSVKRSDYSVAQNDQGTLSVVSGGNDQDPLNIFNQSSNSWVDNKAFFGGSNQVPLQSTSSSSALPSATSLAPESTQSAMPLQGGHSSNTGKILGITLGLLCGIIIVFVLALLLIRRRKQQKTKQNKDVDEKADRMSFQDRGASFMKEAGGAKGEAPQLPPPNTRLNGGYDPRSSFAILAGKFGADRFSARLSKYGGSDRTAVNSNSYGGLDPPPNAYHKNNESSSSLAIVSAAKYGTHQRGGDEKGSFDSTTKLVKTPKTPTTPHSFFDDSMELESMDGETPRMGQVPNGQVGGVAPVRTLPPRTEEENQKKRSSGWSRYFANQQDGGAYHPAQQNHSNTSVSVYSNVHNPSAAVAPLAVDPARNLHPSDAQRLSVVPNGRPSFNHSETEMAARGASFEGQRADFHTGQSLESQGYLRDSVASSRRHSMSSMASDTSFDHNNDAWTPMHNAQTGVAQSINRSSGNSPVIKQVNISSNSPAISASQFPRPPSSSYTADVRDSRMNSFAPPDTLGRALSPPAAVAIPGPAARGSNGGGSFFPGSGTRAMHDRPGGIMPRKLGTLHPGTLAALRFSPSDSGKAGLGITGGDDAYSAAQEQRAREAAFREKLERERAQKRDADTKPQNDISWVNIAQ